MIFFKDVYKSFDDGHKVLNNVNIHINRGEMVYIVGPSGAGKSTIIKLLLKETEVTSGTIIVEGVDIIKLKRNNIPSLRRKFGVVFQDFRLLPDKTVYENVAFGMEVIEAAPKDIRRQVPIALSMVGLSKKYELYPRQLSGGEQQRVALARAMVNSPSILIADEPTGNLDPETSWDIMKLLNEINQRGTTVLMVTHAKDIVNSIRKRVIEISDGRVIRDEARGVYGREA